MHVPFYCFAKSYDGSHVHKIHNESGQYAGECCGESLCNNQTVWPALPPVPKNLDEVDGGEEGGGDGSHGGERTAHIMIAIFSPIAIFVVLVVLVIAYMGDEFGVRSERLNHQSTTTYPDCICIK